MYWIFWAFVGAAVIHIEEEFLSPGGFLDFMKKFNPKIALHATKRLSIIVNSLFLLLCITGAIVASRSLVFSLSVASLLFINALMHIVGTVKTKRYCPGVISGMFLYIPLALYAYQHFVSAGQLTFFEGIISVLMGVLYQIVPIGYLTLSSLREVIK